MQTLSDRAAGATIRCWFTTEDATGAPITLAGSPAARVYVGSSTTELSAGVTLTVDVDARTGLHRVDVDTSADAGYANGIDYAIVLTAGTVSGITVAPKVIAVGHLGTAAPVKSIAIPNFVFRMSNTSGAAVTGATVTATRSLDGGAFASCANAVSELSSGCYVINLAAADMAGDIVTLKFTATNAVDVVATLKTGA